jgi:putative ABC transport system permease protein
LQDIRYAARVMRKSPGFALVAVFTVALGVGANTAIFSVANAVLLRPLPYPESERLFILSQTNRQTTRAGFSFADLQEFRAEARSFEQCAGFYSEMVNFGGGREAAQLPASFVNSDFFAALGTRPALGRAFNAEEDGAGAAQAVVISDRVWHEQFGADPQVVGRKVTLDGRPFEVVGVAPAGFHFREKVDLWLPLGLWPASRERGRSYALFAVARLRPGVTPEGARSEVETIAARLAREYPKTNAERGAALWPLREELVGDVRPALKVLLAAVGLVLLIACANVANLLLARSASRRQELAVRAALGASRARLARQLLTESVLLALVGGALGVLLAFWGVDAVTAAGGGAVELPAGEGAPPLDRNVLLFSLGVSLLSGLFFGLAPALRAARRDLAAELKKGGRGAAGEGRRLSGALVVSEVALSLVLLVGAGLLLKSFMLLRGGATGYNPERVLTVGVSLPRATYRADDDRARFAGRVLERVRALPGVEQAASSYPLPVYGMSWGKLCAAEGYEPPAPNQYPPCQTASVSPGFFKTLEIPLLRGRDFAESDGPGAPPVVVVDETLAARTWPGEDPVGKRLNVVGNGPREVVGLVGAVKNWGLGEAPRPQIYLPHAQRLEGSGLVPFVYFAVRTGVEPETLAAGVRGAIAEADREAAVAQARAMDELLDRSVGRQRFAALLMEIFAGIALVLAAVGLYGVVSYGVARRTREIGIRVALGARPGDVLASVIRAGMRLTLAGLVLGLAGSLTLTRLLAGMLYGVKATDPTVYATVALALAAVALLACYFPARRATRVDPLVALRHE